MHHFRDSQRITVTAACNSTRDRTAARTRRRYASAVMPAKKSSSGSCDSTLEAMSE